MQSPITKFSSQLIKSVNLDLTGLTVYTEAATGAYRVTAGLAALAGAQKVYAIAADSKYGSADLSAEQTLEFANRLNVDDVISIVNQKHETDIYEADIVTNSGHVRPIDGQIVRQLKPTAVIPLMYENWELRDKDIDLAACREKGIVVAGSNESHPEVGILKYLGQMSKILLDELDVADGQIAIWSNNVFSAWIADGLQRLGYHTQDASKINLHTENGNEGAINNSEPVLDFDVIRNSTALVLAITPRDVRDTTADVGMAGQSIVSAKTIAEQCPNVPIAQVWADIDRRASEAAGLRVVPSMDPGRGHMGVLPSDVGDEIVIQLQIGGLKVGEIASRARNAGNTVDETEHLVESSGFGTRVK
jgi:hypothetical protein